MEVADGPCRANVDRRADVVVELLLPQLLRQRLARLLPRKCLDGTVETDSVALSVPVCNPYGWSLDCSMDLPSNRWSCLCDRPSRGEASKMGTVLLLHPNWQPRL